MLPTLALGSGVAVDANYTNGWEGNMSDYEAPVIVELGSVADFTRGDRRAWAWDGFHSEHIIGKGTRGS